MNKRELRLELEKVEGQLYRAEAKNELLEEAVACLELRIGLEDRQDVCPPVSLPLHIDMESFRARLISDIGEDFDRLISEITNERRCKNTEDLVRMSKSDLMLIATDLDAQVKR